MNIEKELIKILKKIEGRVLVIGQNTSALNKVILENNNIYSCDIFSINSGSGKSKKNTGELNEKKDRQIILRNIDKEYKKKDLDYIFCDIEVIQKEVNYFIKNSLFLSKHKIYIYGNVSDYDLETLMDRYKKYNLEMNLNKKDKTYILEITSNSKYKKFKTKKNLILYNMVDLLNKLIDSTGDIMTR